jgi:hypothetical protein
MIVEGAVWNDDDTYRIYDPVFWQNYARHLQAMVNRDKNRPSVVMWSLENEFFGGRLNDASPAKKDLVRMGRLVKECDPTRPIFFESDGDPGGVADVIGIHYPHEYPDFTCWPNEAYWLEKPASIPHMFLNGAKEFVWKKDKPIYVGEFLWIPSRDPSWHTVFFGDEAYKDYHRYRNLAKAEAWKMQILGYRHLEVGGISPWTVIEGGPLDETNPLFKAHQKAYQDIAAYPLEYDSRFYFGDRVKRRLAVFNNILEPSTLDVKWTLRRSNSGRIFDQGEKRVRLDAGEHQTVALELRIPNEKEMGIPIGDGSLDWRVRIERDGQSVFDEVHRYRAAFRHPVFSNSGPERSPIHLYDPSGATNRAFESVGIPFVSLPRPVNDDLGDGPRRSGLFRCRQRRVLLAGRSSRRHSRARSPRTRWVRGVGGVGVGCRNRPCSRDRAARRKRPYHLLAASLGGEVRHRARRRRDTRSHRREAPGIPPGDS